MQLRKDKQEGSVKPWFHGIVLIALRTMKLIFMEDLDNQ